MIILDPTYSGRERWSCDTCWRAVVRQPYMTLQQAHDGLAAFRQAHADCDKETTEA